MAYARINEILVPSPVKAGIWVTATINIQHVAGPYTRMRCTISVNGVYIEVTPSEQNLGANEIGVFYGSFVMPNRDAVIEVVSQFYDYITWQEWLGDDVKTATVRLAPELAEYNLEVSIAAPAVGWVHISPAKPVYTEGEVVALTAYLDSWAIESYEFDYWEGTNNNYANPTTVTMTSNKYVVAHFKEKVPPPPEFRGFSVKEYTRR